MDIVRLVEYIKEGELFDKIDFDQIVSDYDFGVDNIIYIKKISDLEKIQKNKKTLFTLDKLLVENISDFFDMESVSILDLNAGFSSYGNKIGISKYDIMDLVGKGFNVYEPIDLFSMLNILDKTGKNYIRISNVDLPTNFVDSKECDIVSLDNKGFNIGNMTLISTGIMFTETIRLGHLLNEQGIHVKIKILNKLNLDDISLLGNDENIVFILDLINYKGYEKYLKNILKGKHLNFIYPSYDKLSTMMDEYKMEELEFDVLNLANKLLKK